MTLRMRIKNLAARIRAALTPAPIVPLNAGTKHRARSTRAAAPAAKRPRAARRPPR